MSTLKSIPKPATTQAPTHPTLRNIADGLAWFVEQSKDLKLLAEALHDLTLEILECPQDHEKPAVVSEALAGILEQRASTLQEGIAGAQKQLQALSAAAA